MNARSIPESTIQHLADIFRILSDRSRLKIVLALAQQGSMHVSALCKMLGTTSQPAVSHHLTIMKAVGLVRVDRRGKFNYYSLASEAVRELIEQMFGAPEEGTPRELVIQDWVLSVQRRT